tara:strand:+ start:260 stop:457 length:198 start_codon:yes stop_codon:yes gene_type:complete
MIDKFSSAEMRLLSVELQILLKALEPTLVIPDPNVREVRLVRFRNATAPMVVTELGIVKEVRAEF